MEAPGFEGRCIEAGAIVAGITERVPDEVVNSIGIRCTRGEYAAPPTLPGARICLRHVRRSPRQCRRMRFCVSRAIFFRCRFTAAAFLRLRTVVGFS